MSEEIDDAGRFSRPSVTSLVVDPHQGAIVTSLIYLAVVRLFFLVILSAE